MKSYDSIKKKIEVQELRVLLSIDATKKKEERLPKG